MKQKKSFVASLDPMRDYLRSIGKSPPERLSAKQLADWFDRALDHDEPHPDAALLEKLAGKITWLTEAPGAAWFDDEKQRRRDEVLRCASELRAAWAEYTQMGEPFPGMSDTFAGVDELLDWYGIRAQRVPVTKKPGRQEVRWHPYGHKLADMLQWVLREAGHKGALSKKREDSPVAIIGALIVEYFFAPELRDKKLEPSGFAAAMKKRDRSKSKSEGRRSFEAMYPDAAKIRIRS